MFRARVLLMNALCVNFFYRTKTRRLPYSGSRIRMKTGRLTLTQGCLDVAPSWEVKCPRFAEEQLVEAAASLGQSSDSSPPQIDGSRSHFGNEEATWRGMVSW